jgi:hypothetical protein
LLISINIAKYQFADSISDERNKKSPVFSQLLVIFLFNLICIRLLAVYVRKNLTHVPFSKREVKCQIGTKLMFVQSILMFLKKRYFKEAPAKF